MKVLVSEKLSPHKMKTPEGYLICTDAVLARTGKQTYKKSEIFADADDSEIEIDRKPEEVFSEKTLASFENKPITVEHPNEDVNSTNYKTYAVGFVRDVHKGTVDGQDVILGNLVITDAQTIEEIENGEHTDLSCGYDCDIVDEENPQQRNIRGNHVALCEQGRAGNARIIDSVDDARLWGQQYPYELWLIYPKTGRKFMAGAFKTHEEARRNTDRLRKEFTNNVDGIPNAEIRENFRDSVDDAGIKVWQIHQGYAIVLEKYWRQYGKNAYTDAVESSLDNARYTRSSLVRNDRMNFVIIDCNDNKYKVVDSMKDANNIHTLKAALQNLSKMYFNDPGIEHVIAILTKLGYNVSVDSIKGWQANRNIPGEQIKQYMLNIDIDGKTHHALVQLYADEGVWKVKEINAYMLDSMKDELIQSGSKEALKQNIATEIRAGKDPKQAAAIAYNIKRKDDSEMNDADYSRQTKQGYEVVEIYRDGGRLHAIVKRANDYVVALGYDTSDGTWAQGRYVLTYKSALETLKEEKPYARKIQDAESTYTEVTKALKKNEPEVKDTTDKKVIWVKEKGKWLPWGMTSQDIDRERLRKMYHDYEDAMLLPDDGSKPKDSCETKDSVNDSTNIAKIAMQAMKIIKTNKKQK